MTALLQVGDLALDATLLDQDGNSYQLSDLWSDGPTMLTLLRHFG